MAASQEGVMDTNNPEWVVFTNAKRAATSPIRIDDSGMDKKSKTDRENTLIIYIYGKSQNLTRENPLKLKNEIIKSVGPVNEIFLVAKKFLKIYCKSEQQKESINRLKFLGEIEIEISKSKKATEPNPNIIQNH